MSNRHYMKPEHAALAANESEQALRTMRREVKRLARMSHILTLEKKWMRKLRLATTKLHNLRTEYKRLNKQQKVTK